jgi:hypothetical protein
MERRPDEVMRLEAEVSNEPQWVVWTDAEEEREWAGQELDQLIAPHAPGGPSR